MQYDPPRKNHPVPTKDRPLEVDLVYTVRTCGTCEFFWPADPATQTYGPYPMFDFKTNFPNGNDPPAGQNSFVWLKGKTRAATFPDAEVADGCRKAPIMTIGINPNLTAFGPNRMGTSWAYPSFSNDAGTDSWAKYAYYYRYRSIYQEHFDLVFVQPFLLPDGQVKADKAGVMLDSTRPNDVPAYDIHVQYDGDATLTPIHLPGKLGEPRYVVLVNKDSRFKKGDLLAARLDVPAARDCDVFAQPIGYYTQMLPVLDRFTKFIRGKGHADANLQVGEDVTQLDMVACASPHWGPDWLGGTNSAVNTIISNCVKKNAWAMKQMLQTRPAILFLVGQASWNMFRQAFPNLIHATPPLPAFPEDGAYTLLRLMTEKECWFKISTTIEGVAYNLSTRLIVTPHFSYSVNFLPQFRMSPQTFAAFQGNYPQIAAMFQTDKDRFDFVEPKSGYIGIGIRKNQAAVLAEIKQMSSAASAELMKVYYNPHAIMVQVLEGMFINGQLTYTNGGAKPGYLTRSDGPCSFCDNSLWKFPKGCPYNKPKENQYPANFLNKVAASIL
jgi:hypothetical protein